MALCSGFHGVCCETPPPAAGRKAKWSCDMCRNRPETISEEDEKAIIDQVVELCRAFPPDHFGSVLGDQLRAHKGFEKKGRRVRDVADSLRSLWPVRAPAHGL